VQTNTPGKTNVVHTFNDITRMAQATGTVSDGEENFTLEPSTSG
jgi:hypothetical protein